MIPLRERERERERTVKVVRFDPKCMAMEDRGTTLWLFVMDLKKKTLCSSQLLVAILIQIDLFCIIFGSDIVHRDMVLCTFCNLCNVYNIIEQRFTSLHCMNSLTHYVNQIVVLISTVREILHLSRKTWRKVCTSTNYIWPLIRKTHHILAPPDENNVRKR